MCGDGWGRGYCQLPGEIGGEQEPVGSTVNSGGSLGKDLSRLMKTGVVLPQSPWYEEGLNSDLGWGARISQNWLRTPKGTCFRAQGLSLSPAGGDQSSHVCRAGSR